jgi:large subunit ribosomal protein L15
MPLTLDDLRPNPGAKTDKTRVGRGHGSGKGKTAGRGTKGQKARSGPGPGRGFEGGQLPIQKRMPYKRGFVNIFKTPWEVVNLSALADLDVDGPITPQALHAAGITRGLEFPVKILGKGEIVRPVTVHAHAFSKSAREQIEAAGGSVTELERTDAWTQHRPRSRRLPLSREMKEAGVGKGGGARKRDVLAAAGAQES